MIALFKALQVILALSILIIIHEFGHFTFAKLFHIRVDKFFLFFDVGGKALCRFRKGETEFGIGWLPLGGYCKIAGMIDESMDLEQMKQDPQPWEFRTHPAWQRLLVMAGGVLFNLISAVIFYIAISGIWGESYIPNSTAQIYPSELAADLGFRPGDRILAFDDYVPEDFAMLQADLVRRNTAFATVLRSVPAVPGAYSATPAVSDSLSVPVAAASLACSVAADTVRLYIDHARFADILNSPLLFDLAVPFVIDSVAASGPNAGSELRRGDRITSIEGTPVSFLQDARPVLADLAGRSISAVVERPVLAGTADPAADNAPADLGTLPAADDAPADLGTLPAADNAPADLGALSAADDAPATGICLCPGAMQRLEIPLQVDTAGLLGVFTRSPEVAHRDYNLLQAIPAGTRLAGSTISGYLKDMKMVFTPSTGAYKSVGSFIAIGQVFPSRWNWYQFMYLLALLSVMLGIMNLIPIPGLDGGHMLFTIYEMLTGRKPSEHFLIIMQMIGFVLLIMLMMLAFGNDIGRLIR